MYISRLVIRNFRNFEVLDIALQSGVNCVVGANNSGKSNLLHGIRLAIDAALSSYSRQLQFEDFHVPLDPRKPQHILIAVEFRGYEEDPNQDAMLSGYQIGDDGKAARIMFRFRPNKKLREEYESTGIEPKDLKPEDYRWEIVGGGEGDPLAIGWNDNVGSWVKFEELQQAFLVAFMEPLRDVESKLRQSRGSPLAKLIASTNISASEQDGLVKVLEDANDKVAQSKTIKNLGAEIKGSLDKAAGPSFTMGIRLGMAAAGFTDISRGLTVLLSNSALASFDPSRNGLGLNNVLFISMLMTVFEARIREGKSAGQLLLIEEPEAHLHPQLQRVLVNALKANGIQTIVTSHSTHITSSIPLESLVILGNEGGATTTGRVPATINEVTSERKADLERYLDATRGALLFGYRVVLVEGPAEQFLIPALARKLMKVDLEQQGILVIPIYGVHFDVYSPLFGAEALRVRCAIIADGDAEPSDGADEGDSEGLVQARKAALGELAKGASAYLKAFLCVSTFERALATPENTPMFVSAAKDGGLPKASKGIEETSQKLTALPAGDANRKLLEEKLRTSVLNVAKRIGKARFAQLCVRHVGKAGKMPKYIEDAIKWLVR